MEQRFAAGDGNMNRSVIRQTVNHFQGLFPVYKNFGLLFPNITKRTFCYT